MATVLVPLPDQDFDVTEVAVPWRLLSSAGHSVVFATEAGGSSPVADPLLLTGVLFGQLGAEPEPTRFYVEMVESGEFQRPLAWQDIEPEVFDGLLLPGGHAPGMRQYLGSTELQEKVSAFWALDRPVGAICHGVLVLARAQAGGRSLLWDRDTTCLPKYLERVAYFATAWKLGTYYRTYPEYVEDEVRVALRDADRQFRRGPVAWGARDTSEDSAPSFLVEDGNYLSARWPGDAYTFAKRFIEMLEDSASAAPERRSHDDAEPAQEGQASGPPARRRDESSVPECGAHHGGEVCGVELLLRTGICSLGAAASEIQISVEHPVEHHDRKESLGRLMEGHVVFRPDALSTAEHVGGCLPSAELRHTRGRLMSCRVCR